MFNQRLGDVFEMAEDNSSLMHSRMISIKHPIKKSASNYFFLDLIDAQFHSYQNNDQGSHYHQSSGKSSTKVRGRYGSRSPVNGRIDETVYTAGPRG
jgi:hypothetical protein